MRSRKVFFGGLSLIIESDLILMNCMNGVNFVYIIAVAFSFVVLAKGDRFHLRGS